MADPNADLLTDLLRRVSRSFYLTLKVLPKSVRSQIGLAYLLARATDTVADTEIVAVDRRLDALARLRDRIMGDSDAPFGFGDFAEEQGDPSERELLARIEDGLRLLDEQREADRGLIREVLRTIVSGQELDLRRFAGATSGEVIALRNDGELDDYTYRVAGCVGEFWTKICRANVFPRANLDEKALLEDGVRFGKGLQLINILRDLRGDLELGRCYLPEDRLKEIGLKPMDLLEAGNEKTLRPLYDELLARADSHLNIGWDYTMTVPWKCARVRLACAWPILIGARTIDRLRGASILESAQKTKISRTEVKRLMLWSLLLYPLPFLWRGLYAPQSSLDQ